jgi:hypothetical protein
MKPLELGRRELDAHPAHLFKSDTVLPGNRPPYFDAKSRPSGRLAQLSIALTEIQFFFSSAPVADIAAVS